MDLKILFLNIIVFLTINACAGNICSTEVVLEAFGTNYPAAIGFCQTFISVPTVTETAVCTSTVVPQAGEIVTVIETTYVDICPTGLTTITISYTTVVYSTQQTTQIDYPAEWATTVKTCTACGVAPTTVILTVPVTGSVSTASVPTTLSSSKLSSVYLNSTSTTKTTSSSAWNSTSLIGTGAAGTGAVGTGVMKRQNLILPPALANVPPACISVACSGIPCPLVTITTTITFTVYEVNQLATGHGPQGHGAPPHRTLPESPRWPLNPSRRSSLMGLGLPTVTSTSSFTFYSNSSVNSNTTGSSTPYPTFTNSISPLNVSSTATSIVLNSTKSFNSSSSTTASSLPTSSCQPTFLLNGASEESFNPKNTQLSVTISCSALDTSNYTVLANNMAYVNTTATEDGITFAGFPDDYVLLTIFALDITGNEIFQSFQLLFGDLDMVVAVIGVDNLPVGAGILVKAVATTYSGVTESGYTDSTGTVTFPNLIATTIGLTAFGPNNEVGVNGIATTTSTVTVNLLPFHSASNSTNFDFSDGTIDPWSNGLLIPHVEGSQVTKRQDWDLELSTGGQYDLQSTYATFRVYAFTKTAYVRYQFQTEEVPGGYFGTQYNDYFTLSIEDDNGDFASVTNSMNALGLGAFDEDGATGWYTLSMPVNKASEIQFYVGVSNVVDNLFDSAVIIDKVGDLDCDDCSDCSTCPGNPMCQSTCQDPPPETCGFYLNCMEATVPCGSGGYAVGYGDKNCNKFLNNINSFSSTGQSWIYGTLHCLQLALVPAITCDATCDSLQSTAFNSHPKCYVDNGFCTLEPLDYVHVLGTVGGDLVSLEALKEIALTGGGCATQIVTAISAEIEELAAAAFVSVAQSLENLALEQALKIARKFFEDLISPQPQI